MEYLGTYTITPNTNEIEVYCYGTIQPFERQTLEHQGCEKAVIIEIVKHGDIDISEYISTDIFDELYIKANKK